jgi:hypothetical protein
MYFDDPWTSTLPEMDAFDNATTLNLRSNQSYLWASALAAEMCASVVFGTNDTEYWENSTRTSMLLLFYNLEIQPFNVSSYQFREVPS